MSSCGSRRDQVAESRNAPEPLASAYEARPAAGTSLLFLPANHHMCGTATALQVPLSDLLSLGWSRIPVRANKRPLIPRWEQFQDHKPHRWKAGCVIGAEMEDPSGELSAHRKHWRLR
jgi:hypothetical protein